MKTPEEIEEDRQMDRKMFAAFAMMGMLANGEFRTVVMSEEQRDEPDVIAEYSVMLADALLKALKEEKR